MKQLLLLFALLAACSLGCEAPTSTESSMKKSGAEGKLLPEVDSAGLETAIANNPITIIEFTSDTWGPCIALKPWLLETAEKYKGKAKFVAVSSERASDVFDTYSVSAMPTFVAIKDGKEVKRIMGPDKAGITATLESLQ